MPTAAKAPHLPRNLMYIFRKNPTMFSISYVHRKFFY